MHINSLTYVTSCTVSKDVIKTSWGFMLECVIYSVAVS